MRSLLRIAASGTLLAVVSCSNGATLGTVVPTPAPIALQAKLQFGVGTATIGYPGGTFIGTNVVATFRGANGHSATLVNTPTISGPSNFAIGYPGSPNSLTGILPNVYNSALIAAAATKTALPISFGNGFGPFVGVFGYGLAADNLFSSQVALDYGAVSRLNNMCLDATVASRLGASFVQGSAQINVIGQNTQVTSEAQSNELGVPFGYGQGVANVGPPGCQVYPNDQTPSGAANNLPINYYGGPPAWPSAQGYGQPTFFVGYPLGFTDFAAPPVLGNYSLDVAYPTNQDSTTYGHFDATTTLRSIQPLPPIIISKAIFNSSDGTESVTLTVPVGVTETVVTLRVTGCSSSTQPASNYSIVTHSTGTQTVLFPANIGPPDSSGRPIPTVCPGSFGFAAAVGFDYPAYESSYPFNVTQTPTITNAQGQADVTTSAPVSFNIGS